jgi:DNA-binding XRE family transcriptional regulator
MKQEKNTNKVIKTLFPIHSMIYDNVKKSQVISETILEGGNILKIQAELNKKRAEAEMNELNAKVSQELAIANRIANAVDVEIEEIYEDDNSGKVVGNFNEKNPNIELGGKNRKVAKRIYKFKGNITT